MKTIGAMMVKLGGKVRLAVVQEDDNGLKSVVPVGGKFAPFALTPGPSPTSGEGSQAAPTKRVGMVVNQTPQNMFEIGGVR